MKLGYVLGVLAVLGCYSEKAPAKQPKPDSSESKDSAKAPKPKPKHHEDDHSKKEH